MSYWTTVLADSPVFLLKMDEASGSLTDAVGSKTGTATGSPTYRETGPGAGIPYGIAYPSGSHHAFTDHADLDLGDGPWTIECWFKRAADDDALDILGKGSAANSSGYTIGITSTDRIGVRQGDNTQVRNTTADLINNTTWHHFVETRAAATEPDLYIDGTEPAATNVNSVTFTDNDIDLIIGRRYTSTTSFNGTIAAVALYKSALSADRVAAHYAAVNDVSTVAGAFANLRSLVAPL